MKEHNPIETNILEHEGEIIFDKNGNPIGIAICGDGSLDYVDRTHEPKDVMLIIRAPTHNEEQ